MKNEISKSFNEMQSMVLLNKQGKLSIHKIIDKRKYPRFISDKVFKKKDAEFKAMELHMNTCHLIDNFSDVQANIDYIISINKKTYERVFKKLSQKEIEEIQYHLVKFTKRVLLSWYVSLAELSEKEELKKENIIAFAVIHRRTAYIIDSMSLTDGQHEELMEYREQTFNNVKELEKTIKETGGTDERQSDGI